MIPETYSQWLHCITVECGIRIDAAYCDQRIAALSDVQDFRSQQFVSLYGAQHHQRVLGWFQQARAQLPR